MCERMKTISRHYNTLQYERNKDKALKRISTLHSELKFKDVNDFSDRFLQTASVIEKNVSVFKSACHHVDIVTTLIEYLYNVGTTLMFAKNKCSYGQVHIIYTMLMMCKEDEIPSFLKMAIINESNLKDADDVYESTMSAYIMEMIVFEDADLYAVISHMKINSHSLLKMKNIFVQESIKQKFLWLIEENFKNCLHMDLPIAIFHSKDELYIVNCTKSLFYLNMTSIWSENIMSAKALALTLRKDVIFINTHLEFNSGLAFPFKGRLFYGSDLPHFYEYAQRENVDKIDLSARTDSVYNLFYHGKWQRPVENTYWKYNNNVICAFATKDDIDNCIASAIEASEAWIKLPIISRVEKLLKLACTLECNGKFLLAKTVSKWTKISKIFENTLTCQDERLELITIRIPKGITSFYYDDEVLFFSHLTVSLIVGNCVIVLCNKKSCNLTPYFNMFSTSDIPPGVVNLLLNSDMQTEFQYKPNDIPEDVFFYFTLPKNIILPLK